jgi:hypothetical protein
LAKAEAGAKRGKKRKNTRQRSTFIGEFVQWDRHHCDENEMEEGCQLILGLWRWSHGKPTIKGCVRRTTLKTSISRCPAMSIESSMVPFVIKPAGEDPPLARKTGIGEARE